MISGIGLDIIEIDRIERAVNKNERFPERILTENERGLYGELKSKRRKLEFLAGRFAAKEAFAKATQRGIGRLSFKHIDVLKSVTGAPAIHVEGYAPEKVFVSITHSKAYAAAQVIIVE